jgi:hypothetical protein
VPLWQSAPIGTAPLVHGERRGDNERDSVAGNAMTIHGTNGMLRRAGERGEPHSFFQRGAAIKGIEAANVSQRVSC